MKFDQIILKYGRNYQMSKTIEVSKISLQIGKKNKIELSLDEARELQQILADLLGIKKDENRIIINPSP